jgi:hypothetical protein
VELPEAIIELVVEPEEYTDVREHYPLNEDDEQDDRGASQPQHPPRLPLNLNLVILQMIERMACNLEQLNANAVPQDSARAEVQEPDPFSDQDPQKLQTFLMQCRLQF